MPCLAAPTIPIPALPFPLSLTLPTLATPSLSVTFCCTLTLPQLVLPLPPIGLGFLGAAAVVIIQAVLALIQQVNAFLSSLQIVCPLN
jgi:hypothetical protein